MEAACDLVQTAGRWAVIGALAEVGALVAGRAGTRVEPEAR